MKKLLQSILPPIVLTLILSIIYLLPQDTRLKESAIRPDLPVDYSVSAWYGQRIQESEQERSSLAADTRFSKARYTLANGDPAPPVEVSIVYSGSDMNSSIHRPERCLPSQGHNDLRSDEFTVQLDDERTLRFTRLTSKSYPSPLKDQPVKHINHINYYIFIGHESVQSSHLGRTLRDMYDRVFNGYVQRWAYLQVGSYWGEAVNIDEQRADAHIQDIIRKVIPSVLNWEDVE